MPFSKYPTKSASHHLPCAGLLLGPAMNLVLEHLHIHVTGHVVITKLNAPGLMMALIWTCVTLLVLVAYSDLG